MDSFTRTVMEFKCCSNELDPRLPKDGQSGTRYLIPHELGQIQMLFRDFYKFAEKILFAALQRFHRSRSNSSSKRLDDLDGRIKEAIHIFQDSFESHLSNKYLSQQESKQSPISLVDWDVLFPDIDSFTKSMKNLKEEYINELLNSSPAEYVASSRSCLGGNMSMMIGFSDEFRNIRDWLIDSSTFRKPKVVSLVGMAGIGKSTLARKLYEDESILGRFDLRAWVAIGPKYQLKEIMRGILSQVNPETDKMFVEEEMRN